jgi:hypothetical protein
VSTAANTTVQLFIFRAGELRLGIVATAIVRVEPVEQRDAAGCPYIGTLLKLPNPGREADRRMLIINYAGRMGRLLVDGPIRMTRIGARELLPLGRGLRLPALLGFAIESDDLLLLLHIGWLTERAIAHEDTPRLVEPTK